ncbi:taste receptor type 2 member 41-like [Pseudophryne corroboree]|uniref:taste receptor type 2 member 41-like n=1 Tax=Pseudophryne corroboree TaxID=495146 RepID=UPI0030817D0A
MSYTSFISVGSVDAAILLLSAPGNIFILLVNILDAVHLKTLNLSDQLICSISAVNMLQQFLFVVKFAILALTNKESDDTVDMYFSILFRTLTSCNIWLSTWLCVHFCLKLVNINHRCYIYLQKVFPKTFKWILISTFLGSFLISFPRMWSSLKLTSYNNTFMEYGQPVYEKDLFSSALHSVTSPVAIIVLFTSALTIIIALCRHMKRIQDNAAGSRTPSMEAHVRATRTILCLLVIYVFYFIDGLNCFPVNYQQIFEYFTLTNLALGQILSPWILIKGNSKLDKALQGLLHGCSCPRISNDA